MCVNGLRKDLRTGNLPFEVPSSLNPVKRRREGYQTVSRWSVIITTQLPTCYGWNLQITFRTCYLNDMCIVINVMHQSLIFEGVKKDNVGGKVWMLIFNKRPVVSGDPGVDWRDLGDGTDGRGPRQELTRTTNVNRTQSNRHRDPFLYNPPAPSPSRPPHVNDMSRNPTNPSTTESLGQ